MVGLEIFDTLLNSWHFLLSGSLYLVKSKIFPFLKTEFGIFQLQAPSNPGAARQSWFLHPRLFCMLLFFTTTLCNDIRSSLWIWKPWILKQQDDVNTLEKYQLKMSSILASAFVKKSYLEKLSNCQATFHFLKECCLDLTVYLYTSSWLVNAGAGICPESNDLLSMSVKLLIYQCPHQAAASCSRLYNGASPPQYSPWWSLYLHSRLSACPGLCVCVCVCAVLMCVCVGPWAIKADSSI